MIKKLRIDGYIGNDPFLAMFGEQQFGVKELNAFLDTLTDQDTEIEVTINSGGGSVDEGWAIHDKLVNSGKKITTIGEGMVGSIATVVYLAGSVRKMYKNSTFFIHLPYTGSDNINSQTAEQLAEALKVEDAKIMNLYLATSNLTSEQLKDMMSKETRINAEKAKEYGFVNEIIGENTEVKNFKLVSYKKVNQMSDNKQVQTLLDKFETLYSKIKGYFIKNMEFNATNGAGEAVVLYIESETEDLVTKPAFLMDAGGQMTPAPDDTYTLADGKKIVVAGGVVTEVLVAPAPEDNTEDNTTTNAELMNQIAELTEENNSLSAKVTELENSINEVKNLNEELKNQLKESIDIINEFKALNVTGNVENNAGSQSFGKQGDEKPKKSIFDIHAERLKKK